MMRIDALPDRMLIIGGGFVAAEFAHVFGSFGTHVTIVNRSSALLRAEDDEISAAFTDIAQERLGRPARHQGREGRAARRRDPRRGCRTAAPSTSTWCWSPPAAGRTPTGSTSTAPASPPTRTAWWSSTSTSARTSRASGRSATSPTTSSSSTSRTSRRGSSSTTCCTPTTWCEPRHDVVPSAVFSNPQVASVGLTERQAGEQGVRHVVARQRYGDTAYGWAMEDTTGFAKVLADPDTGLHPRRALPRRRRPRTWSSRSCRR